MPYMSELRIFPFNFAPGNWLVCNGQQLKISTNQALYSLLGTAFGGDGVQYFNLPNLQARVPTNMGYGLTFGQSGGEAAHALTLAEIPPHNHAASASTATPDANSALGNNWTANTGFTPYGSPATVRLAPTALTTTGVGLPHQNMSPYVVFNICICIAGVYPSHS